MLIRDEAEDDASAIAALVEQAFAGAAHSDGREAEIVARLRSARALSLSLVAVVENFPQRIVGYAAFSPVAIDGAASNWFGLGPVAVAPSVQAQGIGTALIGEGLARLRASAAFGCVVLGDPEYYRRFGFRSGQGLVYPGPPGQYFQTIAFAAPHPRGTVAYHPAFG